MKKTLFATAQDAESAFYDAFTRQDLEAMMSVWADDDEIYCVHPRGARVSGVAAVRESWRQVFAGMQNVRFRIREHHVVQAMMVSVHSVYEHISAEGETRARGCVLATNVYTRTERGWRMTVHHASPAPIVETPQSPRAKTLH